MTRVLLIDDHPVVRSGLRSVLEGSVLEGSVLEGAALEGAASPASPIAVVGEAATGEDGLDRARETAPDVVLCDLRLGDGIDGIETTRRLRLLDPAPAVLMLTTFDRDAEILGALEAGASGYLLKESDPADIIGAIRLAADGEMYLPPDLAARVMRGMRRPLPKLTEREADVLRLLATGATNREMAKGLFVTEATIKSHLAHIFTKLGVDSRARAIRVATDTGLI